MLFVLVALPVIAQEAQPVLPQTDVTPLVDPTRPVCEIGPDYVVLQWFTALPAETRVQIRQSDTPAIYLRSPENRVDLWADTKTVRTVDGSPGRRTFHTLRINRLTPGKRYFWRIYDPSAEPTSVEKEWGAIPPYRREFAVSTQAGKGKKTIIHIPVKVLLMPNVVDIASAHRTDGVVVPPPAKLTNAELSAVREEYAVASRFFFVNSGMRYFVDFQFFVDDRYQRWGMLPPTVAPAYQNWPVCRSYDDVDYRDPGGGRFTFVDTKNLQQVATAPIIEEHPFPGQIEQAFIRHYNEDTHRWEFEVSGGGSFGPEEFPKGIPGRSQFFGGAGDTAWLVAHEFHHQMEGQGAVSFANREDDRIVYDHPSPRKYPDTAWTTAGRHGDNWDILAFWDRTLTSAQWLRIYFGDTWVTDDRDGDGVPDDDPRLPFDEKRWGSDRKKFATDGRMRDLDKAMLSTFAPAPVQRSSKKPPLQCIIPDPHNPDTDGDGIPDDRDPYPLYPYPPFIYPMTATVDGNGQEWESLPAAGKMDKGGIQLTFKEAHDDDFYYGLVVVHGPWRRIRLTLDGEGRGVFSGEGVQGLQFTQLGALAPDIQSLWGDTPGLICKTATDNNGWTTFEFALPNRQGGKWFWDGGGREIGASLDVMDNNETIYSLYEPYRLFYATMLERNGLPILPSNPPSELTVTTATLDLHPGNAPELHLLGHGWIKDGGTLRHQGDGEAIAYLDNLNVQDFDLWMRFEGKNDGILAAFTSETKPEEMSTIHDYVAFVGGYGNTLSRLRLFGNETGETNAVLLPGEHTMQLTRREGDIWCLLDGKPILFAHDPAPKKIISRLAVFGGYNGEQTIKEIRVRYGAKSSP
jgi:hypothetical protein